MPKFGSAVILAGGKSKRMGFDKKLIQLKNKDIITHLVETLEKEFSQILLSSNTMPIVKYEKFSVIHDVLRTKGPLSGIHSGLLAAASDYVYFIACDMPIVNLEYIKFMKSQLKRSKNINLACVTRYKNWIEPFNSFYHKDLAEAIPEHTLESHSIYSLIKKSPSLYISEQKAREFSKTWDMFININTQEDLERFYSHEKNNEGRDT